MRGPDDSEQTDSSGASVGDIYGDAPSGPSQAVDQIDARCRNSA